MYSYDPLSGLNEEQQKLVLGGECHLWSEQADEVNLDTMLWPRASAVAEVLWSGPNGLDGTERNHIEAARRLSEHRERMVDRGIMAEPIQMPFCLMNEYQCNG
jgi:hexosaminidase